MSFTFSFSESFLESAVLAGVEAYAHGDGRRRAGSVETIGNVWGSGWEDSKTGSCGFRLERFGQSISARRTPDSVAPDLAARRLARGAAARFSPYLKLIGHLHTHPYEDLEDAKYNKGWQFSPAEFRAFLADDDLWEWSDANPVMLVLAVCRLQRVHSTMLEWPQQNTWRFDVGEFRFWLSACVGYMDEDGERTHTDNGDSRVHLAPPLNFNYTGDRVSA